MFRDQTKCVLPIESAAIETILSLCVPPLTTRMASVRTISLPLADSENSIAANVLINMMNTIVMLFLTFLVSIS